LINRSVHDLDLFSAGLAEYPLPGGAVGPTFTCIIGIQFYNLKYGDRFWFEHGHQVGSFSPGIHSTQLCFKISLI
jgi:peroxidase